MYVKRNMDARYRNNFCSGKTISITYFECVFVALSIQHAKCACAILSSVASSVPQNFPILSHKWQDFRKKKLFNIKRVF